MLARHLVEHGPVKTLATPRRVRLLVNGACIADSLQTAGAKFVWEHQYYPQFYLPRKSLADKVKGYKITFEEQEDVKDTKGQAIATTLKVKVQREADGQTKELTDSIVAFKPDLHGKAKELSDMVKVQFSAAGKR